MAQKNLQESHTTTHVAEVVQHGDKLLIPENMDIDGAIQLLVRRKEYMDKGVSFSETYDVFPWDGAHALHKVIANRYGWLEMQPTPGFWGDTPPAMHTVASGPNTVISIPWGRITLPNIDGYIQTGVSEKEQRLVFSLTANVRRKDENNIRKLFAEVRDYLRTDSIYRGKVMRIRFKDDAGDRIALPEPKFIDPYEVDVGAAIFNKDVQAAIETNLYTPIARVQDCLANGIAVKRGVLLGGTFGTGKTLAAKCAARVAADAGITFVYVPHADELAEAINFARAYQSPACVVFCEDIDRVLDGERDVEMDDILNIIDGIDTKGANILVVLTTNELDNIHPAMLRPGRLDAVIEVTPPDADAVVRLLRLYGGKLIDPSTNLDRAGVKLAGTIPAVVAEVVKRAKLVELKKTVGGGHILKISEDALLESAETMRRQLALLNPKEATKPSDLEVAMAATVKKAIAKADD